MATLYQSVVAIGVSLVAASARDRSDGQARRGRSNRQSQGFSSALGP